MSNIKIMKDQITIQPPAQKTVCFCGDNGLRTISSMMNAWLEYNPNARITQMITSGSCVLCLYETSKVVLSDE